MSWSSRTWSSDARDEAVADRRAGRARSASTHSTIARSRGGSASSGASSQTAATCSRGNPGARARSAGGRRGSSGNRSAARRGRSTSSFVARSTAALAHDLPEERHQRLEQVGRVRERARERRGRAVFGGRYDALGAAPRRARVVSAGSRVLSVPAKRDARNRRKRLVEIAAVTPAAIPRPERCPREPRPPESPPSRARAGASSARSAWRARSCRARVGTGPTACPSA